MTTKTDKTLYEYFQDEECNYVTLPSDKFMEWLFEIDLSMMTGVQQMVDEESIIYIIT